MIWDRTKIWRQSLLRGLIFLILVTLGVAPVQANGDQAQAAALCHPDYLAQLETDFRQMLQHRAEAPYLVSDVDYRVAALNYITQAEACFQAIKAAETGAAAGQPLIIDEGGLSPYAGDTAPRYVTGGLKWGAGSPFDQSGQNVPGPGLPGGTVTYSYMPTGVFIVSSSDPQFGRMVTDVRTLPGVGSCAEAEIDAAFAAWSAVANIQFQKVADSNTNGGATNSFGDIRVGAHFFDGTSSSGTILAHAFFPPLTLFPNAISGDLHFDVDEPWSCTPGFNQIDIGIVALHEIGHSIGLGHESGVPAVMNPFYNSALTGLLTDDVNGAAAIYGASSAPAPQLQLSVKAIPALVYPATDTIEYIIILQNTGDAPLNQVVLTSVIPDQTSFVSATASGHETFPGSGEVVWPATTVLAGATLERRVTVEVFTLLEKGDQLLNTVSVSSDELPVDNIQFLQIVDPALVYLPLLRK